MLANDCKYVFIKNKNGIFCTYRTATFEFGYEAKITNLLKNEAHITAVNQFELTPKGVVEGFCPCYLEKYDELGAFHQSATLVHVN